MATATGANNPGPAEWRARFREAFENIGFFGHIGAELVSIDRGVCEMRVRRRPELLQHTGVIHGGVVGALADSAMGTAAYTVLPAGASSRTSILTAEYKVNFLRPAAGEALLARARVLKPGRTLTVVACDLFSVSGSGEVLCATALATMMAVEQAGN